MYEIVVYDCYLEDIPIHNDQHTKNICEILVKLYGIYGSYFRRIKYLAANSSLTFLRYCRKNNIQFKKTIDIDVYYKIKLTYLFVNKNDALKFKIMFVNDFVIKNNQRLTNIH